MYQLVLKRSIKKVNPSIEITSFWNGELALESFRKIVDSNESFPSVVFLDINMPVLDGWQFLSGLDKMVAGNEHNVSIYMISSSLDLNDKNRALSNRFVKDFLIKPISLEILKELFPLTQVA